MECGSRSWEFRIGNFTVGICAWVEVEPVVVDAEETETHEEVGAEAEAVAVAIIVISFIYFRTFFP